MSLVLGLPTLDDLTLLWEAIETAAAACGEEFSEERAAHARVLGYLKDSGVFDQPEAT